MLEFAHTRVPSICRCKAKGGNRRRQRISSQSTTGRVLLTREAGKNGPLQEILEAKGISSFECPMVCTVDGPDIASLAATLANQSFTWVIITSPESARVLVNAWVEAGKPDISLATVGKGTARVIEHYAPDLASSFMPSKANAEFLVAELPFTADDSALGCTVLYPASKRAQNTVQQGLQARGFSVLRLNTYSTAAVECVACEDLQEALQCTVVSIAAPSALEAWIRVAGEAHAIARPVACIGSTSGHAALRLGWPEDMVFWPDSPGMDGFVDSIEEALEAQLVA